MYDRLFENQSGFNFYTTQYNLSRFNSFKFSSFNFVYDFPFHYICCPTVVSNFFALVGPIRHKLKVNQRGNKTIVVLNKQRTKECVYHSLKKDNVSNSQSIFEERASNKTEYIHITRFKKRGDYFFYLICLDNNHQVVDNTASKFLYNVYSRYTLNYYYHGGGRARDSDFL